MSRGWLILALAATAVAVVAWRAMEPPVIVHDAVPLGDKPVEHIAAPEPTCGKTVWNYTVETTHKVYRFRATHFFEPRGGNIRQYKNGCTNEAFLTLPVADIISSSRLP